MIWCCAGMPTGENSPASAQANRRFDFDDNGNSVSERGVSTGAPCVGCRLHLRRLARLHCGGRTLDLSKRRRAQGTGWLGAERLAQARPPRVRCGLGVGFHGDRPLRLSFDVFILQAEGDVPKVQEKTSAKISIY